MTTGIAGEPRSHAGCRPFAFIADAFRTQTTGDAVRRAAAPRAALAALAAALRIAPAGAAAAPAAAGAAPAPARDAAWIRVQTEHLTLYSSASEATTRDIAAGLETFDAALGRIAPRLARRSAAPVVILVFRDGAGYAAYRPRHEAPVVPSPDSDREQRKLVPDEVDGCFFRHPDASYLAVNAAPNFDLMTVACHEYFHFVMSNNFTEIPAWVDEGLAMYYSTFRLEDGRGRIGLPNKEARFLLKEHPPIALSRLFDVDAGSPDLRGGDPQKTFYAEAWALSHMLVTRSGGGAAFLAGLAPGDRLGDRVRALVGGDLGPAQERLEAYVREDQYVSATVDLKDLAPPAPARVAPMPRAEVLYRLGDYLVHLERDRSADAEADLREAVRLDPGLAPAWASLASALDARGRHAEASDFYEKALLLDGRDPFIRLTYARALLDREIPPGITHRELAAPSAALLRARALFAAATEAKPDVADAWEGLGATYTYDPGDVAPGIAALERAQRLLPGREDVALTLAGLYARKGDRARAEELVTRCLRNSRDPAMRAAGEEVLFRADVGEAERLLEDGHTDEGLSRLRALRDRAPDAALRAQVQEALDQSEATADHNRLVETYNEGARLASRGDTTGAAKDFEQVAATAADPELRAAAKDALQRLRGVDDLNRRVALFNKAVDAYNRRDLNGASAILRRLLDEKRDDRITGSARALLDQVRAAAPGLH